MKALIKKSAGKYEVTIGMLKRSGRCKASALVQALIKKSAGKYEVTIGMLKRSGRCKASARSISRACTLVASSFGACVPSRV